MKDSLLVNSLSHRSSVNYNYLKSPKQKKTEDLQYATIEQVQRMIHKELQPVIDSIKEQQWLPKGEITTTVGLLKASTKLPESLSLQEALDLIFYNTVLAVTIPEIVDYNDNVDIIIFTHSNQELLQEVQVYNGEELITTLAPELFQEGGKVTISIEEVKLDLQLRIVAVYPNETKEFSKYIYVKFPVFIGVLSRWKLVKNITYKQLCSLAALEIALVEHLTIDTHYLLYGFTVKDIKEKHIIVLFPSHYSIETININNTDIPLNGKESSLVNLSLMKNNISYTLYLFKL